MNLLFYIFSCFAIVSGIMVIQSRNPVHSVLFLILVFFNSAGLLLIGGLDYFALIFLVVYVGAVAVLFLFVVMMLSISAAELSEKRARYLPMGGLIGFLFLLEIFLIGQSEAAHFTQNAQLLLFSLPKSLLDALLGYSNLSDSDVFSKSSPSVSEGLAFFSSETAQIISYTKDESTLERSLVQWSPLLSAYSNIEAIGLCIYTYFFFFFLYASIILLVAMIGAIVLTMSKPVFLKKQKVFSQNTREFAKTVSRFS